MAIKMMLPLILFSATLLLYTSTVVLSEEAPCYVKEVEYGKVCVCNSTYCDSVPEIGDISSGYYKIYSTSENKPGFSSAIGSLSSKRNPYASIIRIINKKRQVIKGFGGAFTDSTGLNIKSLSEKTQKNLLDSYFADSGIEYSLCRVPIGGTDFSPYPYSYDDVDGDVDLKYFALQKEDLLYKIPLIHEALYRRNGKPFNLFASAWTAPAWMKTNKTWTGYSFLRKENYQLFATYMKRFFEEYAKFEINFWGVTTGNENSNGFSTDTHSKINAMAWILQEEAKWISENLGPTLRYSPVTKDINIIIHDDNRLGFPYVVPTLLSDAAARKYINGVGVHWYLDYNVHPNVLDIVDYLAENVFLLMTEACIFRENNGVNIGSWERGARYMTSILEYLEHGALGWIDWNMALTYSGGPTYIGYPSDSPIIIDAERDEFYKQPMFYAMGHFSKFVISDSVKLQVKSQLQGNNSSIVVAAFQRPDKLRAVIVFNNGECAAQIQIEDHGLYTDTVTVEGNSFNTILYKSPSKRKGVSYNKLA